jgi:hypothetical protein
MKNKSNPMSDTAKCFFYAAQDGIQEQEREAEERQIFYKLG